MLVLVEGLETQGDAEAAARQNLLYALKQNLRQTTRVEAHRAGAAWVDPYEQLEAPRTQTRIRITRGVKLAIALGVLLGIVAVAGCAAVLAIYGTASIKLDIHNDTNARVVVRRCHERACRSFDSRHTIAAGGVAHEDVNGDDEVVTYQVRTPGRRPQCVALAVNSVYDSQNADEISFNASEAEPCPGKAIEPAVVATSRPY